MRRIRKLLRFIKRLWAYLPVIWDDEDWDYMYLLRLVQFKVGRMRSHIKSCRAASPGYSQYQSRNKTLRRMSIVENLIGRLEAGEYCQYEHDEWSKNFVDANEFDSKYKLQQIIWHAEYLENRDWYMVWDIISKYARRWWD